MDTLNAHTKENWLKNIALFLSSQTISLFGSSLVQYAIMWHITLTTESGLMMTLYILCGFIPTFILSPIAGVWADRFNRKFLIAAADGLIALATLILAILFLMGFESIWLLFVMAGGGIIAAWGGFKNRIFTMAFAGGIMGICTVSLDITPLFWIYLIIMGVFGVSTPIFSTPGNVLLQEKISEDYLGRVFGIMGMISTSMMPIGMLIFGPIADLIKIEWLMIATGILMIVLAILMAQNKVLIEAGKPVIKPSI